MIKNRYLIVIKSLFAVVLLIAITACATITTDDEQVAPDILNYISDNSSAMNDDVPDDSISDNAYIPTDVTNDENTSAIHMPDEENQLPYEAEPPCACSELCEVERKQLREWTVEELGEIIVASGTFWTDWWMWRGRFACYHMGSWDYDSPINLSGYIELLPTSGFGSINDIREYLLQFYTKAWVDAYLTNEMPAFIEYNDVLYMHIARTCYVPNKMSEFSFALVTQDGCHAVVVAYICWYRTWTSANDYDFPHFIFTNGRINRKYFSVGQWCFRRINK